MKTLGVFAMLLGGAFGFFHIVETGAGFTVVPKASFTFVDTFISVGDVIRRYNNRSFAEALRGDSQLDNLVRALEKQGFISSSKKPDSEPQTTKGSGATGPEQHSKATTSPVPVASDQKVNSASKAISDNFGDDTFADLLSILSKPTLHCPSVGSCEMKRFTLKPVDINGDGKNEFIVTHGDYCGSGGCTTVLMAKASDNKWAPLAGSGLHPQNFEGMLAYVRVYPNRAILHYFGTGVNTEWDENACFDGVEWKYLGIAKSNGGA